MEKYQQIDIEISTCDKEIERHTEERKVLVAKRAEMVDEDRALELPALIAKIQGLGFSAFDLGLSKKNKSVPSGSKIKKYRHPETGTEWSGRGNTPACFKGKDKGQFLNPAWSPVPKSNLNATANTEPMIQPAANSDAAPVTKTSLELVAALAAPLPTDATSNVVEGPTANPASSVISNWPAIPSSAAESHAEVA
jgi:DNA-binding protein H-NS